MTMCFEYQCITTLARSDNTQHEGTMLTMANVGFGGYCMRVGGRKEGIHNCRKVRERKLEKAIRKLRDEMRLSKVYATAV